MSSATEKAYRGIIENCKHVFAQKNKDYNTAWRILRLQAFTDQIMIKAKRIRTIQEKPQQVADNIATELVGIVNYTILALVQLQLQQDERLHIPYQELSLYYDQVVEEIIQLLRKKNHDYNEAWKDMRIASMVDIILMKLARIKTIEDNQGRTHVSEGIKEGYQDIINYAIFALIQLS